MVRLWGLARSGLGDVGKVFSTILRNHFVKQSSGTTRAGTRIRGMMGRRRSRVERKRREEIEASDRIKSYNKDRSRNRKGSRNR